MSQSDKAKKRKQATPSGRLSSLVIGSKDRIKAFMARRPHRSFRLTKRRDYKRALRLPGYWSLIGQTIVSMKKNKATFSLLAVFYIVASLLLLGVGSQDSFVAIGEQVRTAGNEVFQGNWSEFGQASVLAISTTLGALSPELTSGQQVFAVLLGLLVWLTTVWLLRNRMANGNAKLRDGLYNAGAPLVPMGILTLIAVLQLVPIALAVIGFNAALSTGLIAAGGVEAMLFWIVVALLTVLSVYWITGTLLALVIVTLPGMYPLRALSIAGDLSSGRRLRLLFRALWLILWVVIAWVLLLLVFVLFDSWLKTLLPWISWLPIVPFVVLVLSIATLIFSSTYVYLLYRKIVDGEPNDVKR